VAKRFPPGFSWDWARWREVKLARGIDLNDMVKLFEGVITEDLDVGLNPKQASRKSAEEQSALSALKSIGWCISSKVIGGTSSPHSKRDSRKPTTT
jgi:hypothetical protein